jgi:bloom syndrome protein
LIFCTTFVKDNISYRIREKENDSWGYMATTVYNTIVSDGYTRSSGIVYCLSRKECEYMAKALQARGLSAEFYHAQIPLAQKETVQKGWRSGKILVIVATIAFALGINKPDVRYVIHTSMPTSIESYYQQTGRAGRDGLRCKCTMYYSDKDMETLGKMDSQPEFSLGKSIEVIKPPVTNEQRLDDMYNMCGNKVDCIKVQLSNYLGEYSVSSCSGRHKTELCSNCIYWRPKGPSQLNVDEEVKQIYSILPNTRITICDGRYKIYRVLNELLNQSYLNITVVGHDEIVTESQPCPSSFTINS